MDNKKDQSNSLTPRENFLLGLLNKVIKEYKALLEITRKTKPFKIVEIIYLSNIPGETKFAIQLTNKNCVLQLTAADIITNGYDLNDFNEFHADMIRHAVQGKLIDFLKISNKKHLYKIISKKFDRETKQYIFTIENTDNKKIVRTAKELSQDINILSNIPIEDIYDIGYTEGSESIIAEKKMLSIEKK